MLINVKLGVIESWGVFFIIWDFIRVMDMYVSLVIWIIFDILMIWFLCLVLYIEELRYM